MKDTRIPISYTASEALSYDYVKGCYYKMKSPGEIRRWQPKILYFIALPLAIALSHTIDNATTWLRSDLTSVLFLIFASVFVGLVVGIILKVILIYYSIKNHDKLIACEEGEIVESYHFIVDGIRTFGKQCCLIVTLYFFLIGIAIFMIISNSGFLLSFGIVFVVLMIIVLTSIVRPGKKVRFFVERAWALEGHNVSSVFCRVIYWRYKKCRERRRHFT